MLYISNRKIKNCNGNFLKNYTKYDTINCSILANIIRCVIPQLCGKPLNLIIPDPQIVPADRECNQAENT